MLFKNERLRCPKCGRFSKEPKDIPAGEDVETQCSQGHTFTYHSPAIYYVQAFKDPITGIEGNDSNNGLSTKTPLKTIQAAIDKCKPHSTVFVRLKGAEQ